MNCNTQQRYPGCQSGNPAFLLNADRYPVGMAYVPWQQWQKVYPIDQAISRGTIFPDLDKPFMMGRCRGC